MAAPALADVRTELRQRSLEECRTLATAAVSAASAAQARAAVDVMLSEGAGRIEA